MKNWKWKRMIGIWMVLAVLCGSLGCSGKGAGIGNLADSAAESSGANGGDSGSPGDADNGGSGEKAMGRFLEEEVGGSTLFCNIFDMKKMEDGTVRLLGEDADKNCMGVWDSKDAGKDWELAFEIPRELEGKEGYVDYAALSAGGQAVMAYNQAAEGKGVVSVLYLLDKEGNASRIPFEMPAAKDMPVNGAFDSSVYSSTSVDVYMDGEPEGGGSGGTDGEGQEEGKEPEESAAGEEPSGNQESRNGAEEDPSGDQESGNGEEEGNGLQKLSGASNLILGLSCLGENQVLVKGIGGQVYQVDVSDGSIKQTYEFGEESGLRESFLAGDKLVCQTDTEVLVYDTATGEQQPKEDVLQKSIAESGYFRAVDSLDLSLIHI